MNQENVNYQSYLDHGYVILRNIAGPTRRPDAEFDADDTDPANSARMSFDSMDSGRARDQDLRLAEYLIKNWHTTPLEMIEIWLEVKLPIVIARQAIRHRTSTVNEISGRYVQLPAEWYIPNLEDVVLQSPDKKQGGILVDLSDPEQVARAERYRERLQRDCANSYASYLEAVEDGIAMEQARMHLHVNHYTHWLWKQDLHNMMHFLSLRLHSHAQREAQKLAQAKFNLLQRVLPHSMELFMKYRQR